jgi:legumain
VYNTMSASNSTKKPWGAGLRGCFFVVAVLVSVLAAWFTWVVHLRPRLFVLTSDEPSPAPEIHAVLIAGSNGWGNYRHQADVAHAYHVLRDHGVPEENIVTLVYDDIANNTWNPHPGTIINHPHGKDLYAGLRKDYTHEEVNTSNFLAVLLGDESAVSKNEHASGRVLRATRHDRVFVYYSDHGAPGLLGMPSGDYLYADQLMSAIRTRFENDGFKEMVVFVEACESGSMFDGLLSHDDLMDVWVTTASNPRESSYGVYCPGMVPAPPKEFTTCLGDLYSVAWMEDVQSQRDLSNESLHTLFARVKRRTNLSHVMDYGEREIEFEPVSWYIGGEWNRDNRDNDVHAELELGSSIVEQRDADLVHLSLTDPRAYEAQKKKRAEMDRHVEETVARAVSAAEASELRSDLPTSEWDWACLRRLISTYERERGERLGDYGIKHSHCTWRCSISFISPHHLIASSPHRLIASSPHRLIASSPHRLTIHVSCSVCQSLRARPRRGRAGGGNVMITTRLLH